MKNLNKENIHINLQPKKSINEIINIKEENGEILISGRELHEFLEIGTPYHIWLPRMVEYGFENNTDYTVTNKNVHNSNGGRQNLTDHAMKIDMAKEIAMLQRTEQGKQARKYFIDCEKRLKAQTPALPTTYKDALVALVAEVEAKEQLQAVNEQQQVQIVEQKKEIEVMKPKSAYCDMVLLAGGTVPVTIIAKGDGMSITIMNSRVKILQSV